MRHRRAGRKLNRNATHRLALFRNLSRELIQHERIITTVEKAKELRPFVERLVTLAKRGDLHARRQALSRLGPMANTEVLDRQGEGTGQTVLQKLFSEFGPRFADRPGGYTRIIKRHERRLGDAGWTAIIEFLRAGETKPPKRRAAPAPAPIAPVPTSPAGPVPFAFVPATPPPAPTTPAPVPESTTPPTPEPTAQAPTEPTNPPVPPTPPAPPENQNPPTT